MPRAWFDTHLDLACLAVNGRDVAARLDPAAGPEAPGAMSLPGLADGGVRFALATIFTEAGGKGPEGYPAGDAERAWAVGRAQLEVYLTWRERGLIAIDLPAVLRAPKGVGEIRGGMGVSEVVPPSLEKRISRIPAFPPLHAGILIENADPIRSPGDLAWWRERGVIAIGLAWHKPSRYAGGNSTTDGLTDLGRALVREMDRLGVVHDLSHLSDRSVRELLEMNPGRIMASHSNCRSLVAPSDRPPAFAQRHLPDDFIREIASRGGMIGLNLYSKFLSARCFEGGRATMDETLAHVERVCSLAGNRRCIGLGSDMDGGFSASSLPEGVNQPRDLHLIADALSARGWPDDDIECFAWKNWARFWSEA